MRGELQPIITCRRPGAEVNPRPADQADIADHVTAVAGDRTRHPDDRQPAALTRDPVPGIRQLAAPGALYGGGIGRLPSPQGHNSVAQTLWMGERWHGRQANRHHLLSWAPLGLTLGRRPQIGKDHGCAESSDPAGVHGGTDGGPRTGGLVGVA